MAIINSETQDAANALSLLVVEDDQATSEIICINLKQQGLRPIPCFNATEAILKVRERPEIHAMVVDITLPDGNGIDVLRKARQLLPDLPCFVLSAKDTVDSAVLAMKAGAENYFIKPFDPAPLAEALKAAMSAYAEATGSRENNFHPLRRARHWKSPKMIAAIETASEAANTLTPVLLEGGRNSGKKTIAELIHQGSACKNRQLQSMDLAHMSPFQIEVELFGRPLSEETEESPTGKGRLERCAGTTLYIENIECLSPVAQTEMMHYISSRRKPTSGKQQSCRFITSTTTDLRLAVKEGKFRQDLWYALSVYHIQVPKLAERPEDIPVLCENIITSICVVKKLRRPNLTRKAMEIIMDHTWPGNLSELYNVLEHAVTHTHDGLITPNDFPRLQPEETVIDPYATFNGGPLGSASIDDLTKASLVAALEACGGNRRRAAQRLKVSLRTIYNMIQRYEVIKTSKNDASPPQDPHHPDHPLSDQESSGSSLAGQA